MITKKRTRRPWAAGLLCAVLLLGLLPTAAFAGETGGQIYSITYRANYPNGSGMTATDIKDYGYPAGDTVILCSSDIFDPPAGKAFAGWTLSPDGPVEYQAGGTITMPDHDVNLYAVWIDSVKPGPTDALSVVDDKLPTMYSYGDRGLVLWDPTFNPAFLLVSGQVSLTGGLILPSNMKVDISMEANTSIENPSGPAITAPGGTLTFYNGASSTDDQPSIRTDAAGRMAIEVEGGSVTFLGGNFRIYGEGGAIDAPVAVRSGLGRVDLQAAAEHPAALRGVTVDPVGVVSRGACHAELTTPDGQGNPVHLGSPSNTAISYDGTASHLIAAIAAGTTSEPAAYAVTYKANYIGGPADVTVGGYQAGAVVSVQANPFPAPAGKVFFGWSETEGGAAVYQPGDTFSMPSRTLELYAVWEEEKPEDIPLQNALELSGTALDKVYRMSATVYEVRATVSAQPADTSTLTVVVPGDDQASAGELTVTPQTGDAGLASAAVGDTVVLTGTFSGSPVDKMTCTAAEVYPNPLWGAADGDTFHWTEDGVLVVPWSVRTLTVTGGGAPVAGSLVAAPGHPGLDLTIENFEIDARNQNYFMSGINNAESLTVKGACAASVGRYEFNREHIHPSYAVVTRNLRVEAGASLLAVGETGCFGLATRSVEIAPGGRLTAAGAVGMQPFGDAVITNDGILEIQGDDAGIYLPFNNESVTLKGSGVTRITGLGKGGLFGGLGYGIYAWKDGAVRLQGGRVEIAGPNGGVSFGGTGTVEIGPGVTGAIMGGVGTANFDDQSGGGMEYFDTLTPGPDSGGLDLSNADAPAAYLYSGGTVQWIPAAGEAPARLVLTATEQGPSGSGLYLADGVTLPAGTAVDVALSANTEIQNNSGPAITAPGGTLTFFTDCMDENTRPSLHGGAVGQVALKAPGGSVAFTGGIFQVYGKGGASDAPIAVRGGLGRVEMQTEAAAVPAAPAGITVDPTGDVSRAARHAELTTRGAGGVAHVPGSPSNSTISYNGTASDLIAAIVAGTVDEPTPPPSGGSDDGPSTYQVVYRPGYQNGPNPMRTGGYEKGDKVTVRENPFPAPAGKVFAGWSEKEGGAAKYQSGDTLSMPSNTLNLYAAWEEQAEQSGPSLNKTDHTAYLTGYPDGRVGPADLITREQTAMIFFRLLDADSRTRYHSTSSPFPDVADTRWSAEAMATMASAGALKGRPDGSFAPEAPITRAEFAAIAARFDSEAYSGPDLFPDIAGHWAAAEINQAARRGWVKGGADGLFRPNDPITRAEAAALVNRVLERTPESADDLLEGMKTFPDNADPAVWYYLDLQEAANGHSYERKSDGVHERWTGLD